MSMDSLTTDQLLLKMEAPDMRGIFVLGSFARHVTIYSQQVRALNLIHALCAEGRLDHKTKVAVIGAGAAGLTAAAGAAVRGADVVILEKLPGPLSLQRPNAKRYLHPHIYYWPEQQEKGDHAGLPLLDWKADVAQKVFAKIDEKWQKVLNKAGAQITPRYQVKDIRIHTPTKSSQIYVSWKDVLAEGHRPFDIVILAVGFGLDDGKAHELKHYWQDDDLDDRGRWLKRKILVSGTGDGGLTDLMRLCIANFRHDEVIQAFAASPDLKQLQDELLEIERNADITTSEQVTGRYRTIVEKYSNHIKKVINQFELRNETEVFLVNQSSDMLGFNSSMLNRFIVSVLDHLKAFTYLPGGVDGYPERTEAGMYQVKFKKGQILIFDEIIHRHGPNPALKSDFPRIWEKCAALMQQWNKWSQVEDRTWKPMYKAEDFDFEGWKPKYDTRTNIKPPLPALPHEFDFGADYWCVVVVPSKPKNGQETALERLLRRVLHNTEKMKEMQDEVQHSISRQFVTFFAEEAFSDPESYNRLVRALCCADVATFDVTDYDPAIMLLLGIRSAVRRGVTILAINKPITPESWSELPFNIKELNLFSTLAGNKDQNAPDFPTNLLQSFITTGLRNLRMLPHYLDVPAYEWVRRFGLEEDDYKAIPEKQQILLLCPFSDEYTDYAWNTVVDELTSIFHTKKVARIIDNPSPQLVSQRLYDAIRRSALCIVDWTGWRPNVFYEMGVRLTVSDRGPICIIASESSSHQKATDKRNAQILKALERFFSPIEYKQDGGPEPFEEVRRRWKAMRDKKESLIDGRLAHNHTFRIVCDAISLKHELADKEPYIELERSVDLMVGKEYKREGIPRALFANDSLYHEVQANAIERLIAAWYYLKIRCHAATLPDQHAAKKAFRRIGARLASLLDQNNEDDKQLADDIQAVLNPTEGSS